MEKRSALEELDAMLEKQITRDLATPAVDRHCPKCGRHNQVWDGYRWVCSYPGCRFDGYGIEDLRFDGEELA
jgi:hypothetical protein